jgi:hypothetical protein
MAQENSEWRLGGDTRLLVGKGGEIQAVLVGSDTNRIRITPFPDLKNAKVLLMEAFLKLDLDPTLIHGECPIASVSRLLFL